MKRTGKFYRKNEREVMESLGLEPTPNSGSGWIIKEDGQSEDIICQLKSTDAQSIKVNQKDLRILEKNAIISHKLPVFAIQFLNTNEVWLMCKPEDICDVSEYLNTGNIKRETIIEVEDVSSVKSNKVIKSSGNAREQFHEELNKKYDRTKPAK